MPVWERPRLPRHSDLSITPCPSPLLHAYEAVRRLIPAKESLCSLYTLPQTTTALAALMLLLDASPTSFSYSSRPHSSTPTLCLLPKQPHFLSAIRPQRLPIGSLTTTPYHMRYRLYIPYHEHQAISTCLSPPLDRPNVALAQRGSYKRSD